MTVTAITTAFPPGGSGTITITDTTAAAIIAQTAANELLWGPAALIIPGSPIAVMSATQGTLSNILDQLKSMDDRLKEVGTQVTALNGQMESSRSGLASISTHMGQQATIQKLAYLDQTKHNEFQQLTTNASLADAGKPPTVVTPQAFVAKVETTLKDLTIIEAQTTIVTSITEYAGKVITTAYDVSLAWAVQTEIGGWIAKKYAEAKLAINSLFTVEKVQEVARKTNQTALNVKGGNPTTLG
jgi:hypothetical protein